MSFAYIKIEIPKGWSENTVKSWIKVFNAENSQTLHAEFIFEED
jgi:hypothetical protein